MLYHYTSIETVKRILENKQFWMTKISDFDDSDEFKYAISEVAKELSISHENSLILYNEILEHNKNIFVGCFCNCKDSVFLWKNYGDINIEFSRTELISLVHYQQRSFGYISRNSNFLPCEYHRNRHKEIIKGALNQWKENDTCHIPVNDLAHLATFFKKSEFCTEQETRLVLYLKDGTPIKTFRNGNKIKHYWVLPFYGYDPWKLIKNITIGPIVDYAKVEDELRIFFKVNNIDGITINHCKTSYEECSNLKPISQKICNSCEWFMFPSQDIIQ